MKTCIVLCLLFGLTLPHLVLAQRAQTVSPSRSPASAHLPANNPDIVSFHVQPEGALHIVYSDGTEVEVPKERGRFGEGEHALTQEAFSDIQLADDRQHIGWLATYMLCQQSYPCPAELVLYCSGRKLHIPPLYGIVWRWKFLEAGKRIVVQSGFPHGDVAGAYALYDTETGREFARFSSKKKKAPHWVQQLRRDFDRAHP